jgi:hypothetical protein
VVTQAGVAEKEVAEKEAVEGMAEAVRVVRPA